MTQGVFTGVITQIGSASVSNGQLTTASVIEIGEHTFRNISYTNYIDTYLSQALKSGEPLTIAIFNNRIIALKLNGKKYYQDDYDLIGNRKIEIGGWAVLIFLGVISFGIGGIAMYLYIAYDFHKEKKNVLPLKEEFERTNA